MKGKPMFDWYWSGTYGPEFPDSEKWFFCSNDAESRIVKGRENAKMMYEGGIWTSSSSWYCSERSLREGNEIQDEPCCECGRLYSTHYVDNIRKKLKEQKVCHTCNFWREYVEKKDAPQIARINGTHYWSNPKTESKSQFLGFGGRLTHIRWNDGREVETNDLWYQGAIPDRFRERLPDNAIFVRDALVPVCMKTQAGLDAEAKNQRS